MTNYTLDTMPAGFKIKIIPTKTMQRGTAALMIHPDDIPDEWKKKDVKPKFDVEHQPNLNIRYPIKPKPRMEMSPNINIRFSDHPIIPASKYYRNNQKNK